jgi:DNA-directed RNA polymerase subunit E'/Rpb7
MEQPPKSFKPRNQYKQREIRTVYSLSQITKKIALPINAVGRSLQKTIEETIAAMVEGKCIVEGYVKPHSVRVITYSSGLIKGTEVVFDVVFECEVCFPVAGMLFNCVAKNITKAGIRAESADEIPSPFVLFVARDHYYASDYFNSIEENEKFTAKVIAQRFELNDKYVSIIAELVTPKKRDQQNPNPNPKPRIDFEE